jgi:enoyl-CoA hydratase
VDARIITERDGDLVLLLIHNPRLRNALSEGIVAQLRHALMELSHDDEVGALIISSAVEGIFVSGGNIRELRALAGSTEGLQFAESMQAVFKMVEDFPKPVVAVITGFCLGAGAELAMAADVRIAAVTAVFASPQVGLGITPGLGGGQRTIRLCGTGHAKRLILTGEQIPAGEALRLGLVERVVPASELWDAAKDVARKLASKPRTALALAKRALNYSSQANLVAGCAYEAGQFGFACSVGGCARLLSCAPGNPRECI